MKPDRNKQFDGAFTLLDLLILLATGALLVGVLLPALAGPRKTCGHNRMNCVSNLKQIGLAMRMWSNDHNDQFPWRVSTNEGGSMEFLGTGEVVWHFLAISNELNTPKVLACHLDTPRLKASAWAGLSTNNISYFIGLDANEGIPQTILSGDRNVITGIVPTNNVLQVSATNSIRWTSAIHNKMGNIALADGSAQQTTAAALQKQAQSALACGITNTSLSFLLP